MFVHNKNKINENREEVLQKNVTPIFLKTLREESFEFGYTSESERIIKRNSKLLECYLEVLLQDF